MSVFERGSRWNTILVVVLALLGVLFAIVLPAIGRATRPAQSPSSTMTVGLFFVALDDGGKSGKAIGCNDSIIPVARVVPPTSEPLTTTIAELLSIRDRHYGQSGLYNALAASTLKAGRVSLVKGVAEIRLTGTVSLGGTCDGPRVDAQIRETVLQFPAVKTVAIFINDEPIEKVLSGK